MKENKTAVPNIRHCAHCGCLIEHRGGVLWHEVGGAHYFAFPQYCRDFDGHASQLHEPNNVNVTITFA